ncbi:MAG: xylulokinase [Ignavibacteriaceae bacterium]
MNCLLGIDVSTTATKVMLIDESGNIIGVASCEYSIQTPHPHWSEQDPKLWWAGTIEGINEVMIRSDVTSKEIHGIGLTGQMHGLVLLDNNGKILRPAILWNDQRTQSQCNKIRSIIGRDKLIHLTGNDALTGFTAPKILWVKENEPEIFASAKHILLPKDYIRYRLTGEYATDKADASGTLLFDVMKRDWSVEVVDALSINKSWLPESFEGTEITGVVTEEAASLTGLLEGTPVVAGAGDQAAQAVGVGAVEEGVTSITLGTSGVVFASTNKPYIEADGKLHSFCHAISNRWHLMGVMLSAAGSIKWFHDTFASDLSYDELNKEIDKIAVNCDGLLFLPYLSGERTPHPDPLARGSFIGLTLSHSRAHLARAVMEGVAFGIRDCFELIKEVGLSQSSELRVSGGGAKSNVWMYIIASVLNSKLITLKTTEGAALGAAILAGLGTKIWADITEVVEIVVKQNRITEPNLNDVEQYEKQYQIYKELYPSLKNTFNHIDELNK